jgi:hypothetical protein
VLAAFELTRACDNGQFLLIANLHLTAVWGFYNDGSIGRGYRL